MRKTLAIATLAGSMAVTGLALTPAAQAATTTTATTTASQQVVTWGKFFSSDHKAYTFGRTWKSGGKVHTKWYGVDKAGGKKGWVWFRYYQNGAWHTFNKSWDGKVVGTWSGRGIKKIYTYTCWAGKSDNCGRTYRIF
ncbi:hypothetical protein ACWGH8_14010 [Nonomuraea muscovyensis]|jgi:hypothetical protein|uniref:Uncharacterized protein n=1 Tax=Nonomuraea muscovyensis TaxID=1124761 RepID=A0A7X0C0Z1_9ACTN|nr:hypothetical protein [Nonomuraea muscovyensis]MBB6346465.1 hypothetical protein [Nonomuraea muscovyensis]MDF2708542.1 hypothetical protein [Nonomuraea muscovyensis]